METFSALLAFCAGNSPVTGEFPAQRPVTRMFDAFFDLRLNKRLSKNSGGWWLRRHRARYDVIVMGMLRHHLVFLLQGMEDNYPPIPLLDVLGVVNQDELSQTSPPSASLEDNSETNPPGQYENNTSEWLYPQQASPSPSLEVTADNSDTYSTCQSDNDTSEWVYVPYARNPRKHPPRIFKFEIREVEPLDNIQGNNTYRDFLNRHVVSESEEPENKEQWNHLIIDRGLQNREINTFIIGTEDIYTKFTKHIKKNIYTHRKPLFIRHLVREKGKNSYIVYKLSGFVRVGVNQGYPVHLEPFHLPAGLSNSK